MNCRHLIITGCSDLLSTVKAGFERERENQQYTIIISSTGKVVNKLVTFGGGVIHRVWITSSVMGLFWVTGARHYYFFWESKRGRCTVLALYGTVLHCTARGSLVPWNSEES